MVENRIGSCGLRLLGFCFNLPPEFLMFDALTCPYLFSTFLENGLKFGGMSQDKQLIP